jgi:ADP-ribose pyrophosphatase
MSHIDKTDIFSQLDNNSRLIETTISSENTYQGFLKIVKDIVTLPNDHQGSREYINHPGAVMIIPILKENQCLLEYQYRHPLKKIIVEFPAGKIDQGEAPLDAAKRELLEETGFTADIWHDLGKMAPVAAYSTEYIQIYIAENLSYQQQMLDEDEHLQTFTYPIESLKTAIHQGDIIDGKTIIGIYRLLDFLADTK